MDCVLRWESCVTTAEEVAKRMKLQVRKVQELLGSLEVIESDFSKDDGQAMLVRRTQTSIGGSVRG